MENIDLVQIYSNAVGNVLLTSLYFIPIFITLIQDRYALGEGWCVFSTYFLPGTLMVYLVLMNTLGTILRVYLLDKPAKVKSNIPVIKVWWVNAGCAVLSIIPSIAFSLHGVTEECFMVGKLSCSFRLQNDDNALKAVWWVYTILLIAIPLIVLICANAHARHVISKMLANSRTVTREQKCRVSLTLCSVSWSFLLSYLPTVVVWLMTLCGWQGEGAGIVPKSCLITTFCLPIAAVAKPFIIYLSNVKFREYVDNLLGLNGRLQGVRIEDTNSTNAASQSPCRMISP